MFIPPAPLPTIVAACSAISSVSLQLRILDRGPRGDHRELREAIEHAQPLRIEMLRRIEIENLGRNAGVQTLGRNYR